jgi:uncharacterized lipoprotein YddW (UPF0748 family)
MVRRYAKSGINLIHPEVIYNGYCAYPSSIMKQKDLWNGLDMLPILIDEAHKNHVEVHPWVWVFRAGYAKDMGGILKDHPDWACVNKEGKTLSANQGYWLDPCNPAVRGFLLSAFKELVDRFPIDGIQLDYVRFEDESPVEYGFNDDCRSAFKAQYGIDPMDIQPFTKPVLDWEMWRENLIDTFVEELSADLRKIKPNLKISAAVASLPDHARTTYMQDWPHWAENGWVDFVSPMDYTPDGNDFLRRQKASMAAIGSKALIAPGIGLYTMKSTTPMLDQIGISRNFPMDGVTIFASAYLDEGKLADLEQGPFNAPATLPFRDPLAAAASLSSSASAILSSSSKASIADLNTATNNLAGAERLLAYAARRLNPGAYTPPTPPPIFIPIEVQPMPEVSVPFTDTPPAMNANLSDSTWQKAARITIKTSNLGLDITQPTEVLLLRDSTKLYVGFRVIEPHLGLLKSSVTAHDGPVFDDDSVELFLQPANQAKPAPYFHFAANCNGTKFEEEGTYQQWSENWEAATGRETDAWTAEFIVPYQSIRTKAPDASTVWRVNFCRNRFVTGGKESSCWSPTYGTYHTPIRFGTLSFK